MFIQIDRLDKELPIPSYANYGDAGVDLYCSIDFKLDPGERKLIPTGVAMAIPYGYAGFIHPRSGLAHKFGISVVNAPGTIDAGYRGQIFVNLINLNPSTSVALERGTRIAQMVFQAIEEVEFVELGQLPDSYRGISGHGSTGLGV
jgi:dUTP pyrophosphatase